MHLSFLRFEKHYPLYFQIRLFYHRSSFISWLKIFILYIQYTFQSMGIHYPSEFFSAGNKIEFWKFYKEISYFLVWLFGTEDFLFDQIIFSFIHFFMYLIFIISSKEAQKKVNIGYWKLVFISFFQNFYCEIFILPFTFRLSACIEAILRCKFGIKTIIALILCIFNIFFLLAQIYKSSIFLSPFIILRSGDLDYFDGKSIVLHYIIRIFLTTYSFLSNFAINDYTKILMIFISLTIFFYLMYFKRLIQGTFISQFLNFAPIIPFPFVWAVRYWLSTTLYWSVITVIFVQIIVFSVLKIIQNNLEQKANRLVKYYSDSTKKPPNLQGTNIATLLRLLSIQHPDPSLFMKILNHNHFSNSSKSIHSSYIIEIARVFAIYPSQRSDIYEYIISRDLKSKSPYNSWLLYAIKRVLELMIETDEVSNDEFNVFKFYQKFNRRHFDYWICRQNKKYLSAFANALSSVYCYLELHFKLIHLYHFCPNKKGIEILYRQFILQCKSDFDGYQKINPHFPNDFVFNSSRKLNSLIPQFNKHKHYINTSKRSSSDERIERHFFISNESYFPSSQSTESMNETTDDDGFEKTKSKAAYLEKSRHCISIFSTLPFVAMVIILWLFIFHVIPIERQMVNLASTLTKNMSDVSNNFHLSIASIACYCAVINATWNFNSLIPYIKYLSDVPLDLYKYFNTIPILTDLHNITVYTMIDTLQPSFREASYSLPTQELNKLIYNWPKRIELKMKNYLNEAQKIIDFMTSEIQVSYKNSGLSYSYDSYIIWCFYLVPSIILILFILMFYRLMTIMNKKKIAIDFFTSVDRLNLVMKMEALKSFDLIKQNPYHLSDLETSEMTKSNDRFEYSISLSQSNPPSFSNISEQFFSHDVGMSQLDPQNTNKFFSETSEEKKSGKHQSNFFTTTSDQSSTHNIYLSQLDQHNQNLSETSDINKCSSSSDKDDSISYENSSSVLTSKTKRTFIKSWFIIFLPYIFILAFLVLIIILQIPLNIRLNDEEKKLIEVRDEQRDIYLLFEMFSIMIDVQIWASNNRANAFTEPFYPSEKMSFLQRDEKIQDFMNEILSHNTQISKGFLSPKCFQTRLTKCGTVYSFINDTLENGIIFRDLVTITSPILTSFMNEAITKIYIQNVEHLKELPHSSEGPFLVLFFFLSASSIALCLYIDYLFYKAFNSLFHYPSQLIKEQDALASNINIYMPKNCIIIHTLNGIICNVSPNCRDVLRQDGILLIDHEFDKVFSQLPNSNLLEFKMPKRTIKFRFSSSSIGNSTQYTLFQIAESSNRNIKNKIYNFLPRHFADQVKNGQKSFEINEQFIVLIHLSVPNNNSLMKFFNQLESIEILKKDGKRLLLAIPAKPFPLNLKVLLKNIYQKESDKIKSIVIGYEENGRVNIIDDGIPFVDLNIECLKEMVAFSYNDKDHRQFQVCVMNQAQPLLKLELESNWITMDEFLSQPNLV